MVTLNKLETLRKDFKDAREMMLRYDEWTPEQAAEVTAAIAEVVKANDAGEMDFWCAWFAIRGEAARALAEIKRVMFAALRGASA